MIETEIKFYLGDTCDKRSQTFLSNIIANNPSAYRETHFERNHIFLPTNGQYTNDIKIMRMRERFNLGVSWLDSFYKDVFVMSPHRHGYIDYSKLRGLDEFLNRLRTKWPHVVENIFTVKTKSLEEHGCLHVSNEHEVIVSDIQTFSTMLAAMGFQNKYTYEKIRVVFDFEDAEICYDVLPYGVFFEVEGDIKTIEKFLDTFGYNKEDALKVGYVKILKALQLQGHVGDATFSEMSVLNKDISGVLKTISSGNFTL